MLRNRITAATRLFSDYLPSEAMLQVPKRVHRNDETIQVKRARLLYQSRKRGILESDLLCSTFAGKYLDTMTSHELDRFDAIMDENDWDICKHLDYWCSNKKPIPEHFADDPVLLRMKEHFKNEGREILRMPNLSTQTKP